MNLREAEGTLCHGPQRDRGCIVSRASERGYIVECVSKRKRIHCAMHMGLRERTLCHAPHMFRQ